MHCGMNLTLNDEQPRDDRRYYITRIIKQGGQGSVYEGIDQDGRVYAIKEMLDHFVDPKERAEATRRFEAEATILKKLRHPRIPKVYSHFTDEGRHYLTMDFVHGNDLEHIVEQRRRIAETQVLDWTMQICDVLDYLHSEGLVYRDVKPSNIMINRQDGGVKLVDFGIAKILNPTERGGTQIGTPGYAPPEQYQGLATPASDIYALGATLHHLLTGRDPTDEPPFSFPPARSINPSLSPHVSDALQRALQMKPEDRFGSIKEFQQALRPDKQARQVRVAPSASQPAAPPASVAPRQGRVPVPATAPVGPAAPPNSKRTAKPAPPPPVPAPQQRKGVRSQTTPLHARPQQRQRGGIVQWLARAAGRAVGRMIGDFVSALLHLIKRVVITTLIVVAVALVTIPAVHYFFPGVVPLPEPIEQILPTGAEAPAAPALQPQRELPLQVQSLVESGANEQAVLAALRAAYQAEVLRQYPGAQVNTNLPITRQGEIQQVGQENGQTRYQATMSGFVELPEDS